MSGDQPVCICCGQTCLDFAPRLLGRCFVCPDGYVELNPSQARTVALFLVGPHTLEQAASALGLNHARWRAAATHRISQANEMLRVKGWGLLRAGKTYELKRRRGP